MSGLLETMRVGNSAAEYAFTGYFIATDVSIFVKLAQINACEVEIDSPMDTKGILTDRTIKGISRAMGIF